MLLTCCSLIAFCLDAMCCQTKSGDRDTIPADSLVLTTANPSISIRPALSLREQPPEILEIGIVVLQNDSLENFFVDITIGLDSREEIRLGSATPIPLDGHGHFIFRADKALRTLWMEKAGGEVITLRLTLKQETQKGSITVLVDSLRWRRSNK
jgi:hypothetical protein